MNKERSGQKNVHKFHLYKYLYISQLHILLALLNYQMLNIKLAISSFALSTILS